MNDDATRRCAPDHRESPWRYFALPIGAGIGVAIGTGLGAAFGIAAGFGTHWLAVGAGIGTALGTAAGAAFMAMRAR